MSIDPSGLDALFLWGQNRAEDSPLIGREIRTSKYGFNLFTLSANPPPVFDVRTEKNIVSLLPAVQDLARQHVYQVRQTGADMRIISGTRTFAQQNVLYTQGRTAPGNVATNAKGGFSNHNFGVAYDVGFFDSKGSYVSEGPDYDVAGQIGTSAGLEWGGNWTGIVDRPHFQLTHGLTISQMRNRVESGQSAIPQKAPR